MKKKNNMKKTLKADAVATKKVTIQIQIVMMTTYSKSRKQQHQTLEEILQHKIITRTMDDHDDDDRNTWVEVKKRSNPINKGHIDHHLFTSKRNEISTTQTSTVTSSCSNQSSECNEDDDITTEKDTINCKDNQYCTSRGRN